MTNTASLKAVIVGAVMVALMVPAMTFAASPTVTELQSQFQTLMSRFEQMKEKRGVSASSTASSTDKMKERKASTTVDRTCMAAAVATREASIKTAWTTFTGSITVTLDKRSAALVAAWNASAEGSREAIMKAWTDWKKDKQAANTALKSSRKAAWDAFKKTAKDSCKVETPKAEGLERSGADSINL